MKVLITGGAGFIGSHLIDRLVERGDEIVCLDAFTSNYAPAIKRRNIAAHLDAGCITLVEADINDADAVNAAFETHRPERVVHLAARVAVGPSVKDPAGYEHVNVGGTMVLLDAAVRHEVKQFIFGSSSSIYGNCERLPLVEEGEYLPISPYAATKRSGELMCHTWHALWGLRVTCLRFFTVYGPRQRPDMAVHRFVRMVDAGEVLPRFGDGTSRRDYTFVSDIVQGIEGALDNVFDFEIINLGESRTISLNDLIATIERVTAKKARIEERPWQQGDVRETYADISRARRLLGYEPKVTIEAGIGKFWTWYRQHREILSAAH